MADPTQPTIADLFRALIAKAIITITAAAANLAAVPGQIVAAISGGISAGELQTLTAQLAAPVAALDAANAAFAALATGAPPTGTPPVPVAVPTPDPSAPAVAVAAPLVASALLASPLPAVDFGPDGAPPACQDGTCDHPQHQPTAA